MTDNADNDDTVMADVDLLAETGAERNGSQSVEPASGPSWSSDPEVVHDLRASGEDPKLARGTREPSADTPWLPRSPASIQAHLRSEVGLGRERAALRRGEVLVLVVVALTLIAIGVAIFFALRSGGSEVVPVGEVVAVVRSVVR